MSSGRNAHNVVVLGMHRSGTSVVSGALLTAGLSSGADEDLLPPQEDNPRGFWERGDVVALNDRMLADAGGSWYLPVDLWDRSTGTDYDADIRQVLEHLPERGWLLKDPRFTLTWPIWQRHFENAAVVYVYRAPIAVAASLERRNGLPMDHGLALWEWYNRAALSLLRGVPFTSVGYEALARNPEREMSRLRDELARAGVGLERTDLGTLFEPDLDHSPGGSADGYPLSTEQIELHENCTAVVTGAEPSAFCVSPSPPLAARLESFARAYSANVEATTLKLEYQALVADQEQLLQKHEALVHEHEALVHEHEALERDVDERTRTLSNQHDAQARQLNELRAEYQRALLELDRRKKITEDQAVEVESLKGRVRDGSAELADRQLRLQEAEAKAEYLFRELQLICRRLMAHSTSFLGRQIGTHVRLYKYLTLRPASGSAYEEAVAAALSHLEGAADGSRGEPSRALALLRILRFVVRNPYTTLRSATFSRGLQMLHMLRATDPDDLAQWVQQRFPSADPALSQRVEPVLSDDLDELQLSFPHWDRPRVSIVIPVYNQYRMTINCLRSVLQRTKDVPYEVIIGDDASSDLTHTIEARIFGVTVVRSGTNGGFLTNCNAAAERARGDFILFLNNDTEVTDGWLAPMVDLLESDDSIGVTGPKLLFGNGRLQEAGGIVWNDASGWNFGRGDDANAPPYNYVKECDYVSGACLLVRKDLWQLAGGFDRRFAPAYYEDTDLCFFARSSGYKVVYQPASVVYHFEGSSHGTDLGSGIKSTQLVNQRKFHDKWADALGSQPRNGELVFAARDRSLNRRTILVVDHYVPFFDKDAGSRATWLYLKLFASMGYNVKFLGANFFPHQPYTQALQQAGIEVLVGEQMARDYARWLQRNAKHIDVIYLNRPHVAEQFLDAINLMEPRPRVLYFGHDLHYLRKQREFELLGNESIGNEAQDWRRRERRIFEQVDAAYFPSEAEVREVSGLGCGVTVKSIPLYVHRAADPIPEYSATARADVLFVGGFNHPPNLDGVLWFVDEVLPLVAEAEPACRLHIVGSSMPARLRTLASDRILTHGFVTQERLDELYASVALAIVPLRFGAGVKGKVIEAMQNGVPIVTTGIGAEGFPEAESVFFVADDHRDFARVVAGIVTGTTDVRARLRRYEQYLIEHFGEDRVRNVIRAEFGEPHVHPRSAISEASA